MVGALHSVLTEQGLDPRDFVLVAFGGAGPPHVSDLMTDASIPRGLVPNFPGQFSALGFHHGGRTRRPSSHRAVELALLRPRAGGCDDVGAGPRNASPNSRPKATPTSSSPAASRCVTSARTTNWKSLPTLRPSATPRLTRLLAAFHDLHEARFGFRLADHIEIVNFLVTGIAKTGQLGFPEIGSAKGPAAPVSRRPVWFAEGWVDTPVYARADLLEGHALVRTGSGGRKRLRHRAWTRAKR